MITLLLAPITLVGVLTEQGDRACVRGDEQWVNVRYEVGFHPVTLPEAPSAELIGRPVVVVGERTAAPERAAPTDDMTCPPIQARSDWVPGKGGIRLRRSDAPPPQHVAVQHIRPFTGLRVEKTDDHLTLALENTLDVALEQVEVRVHYEGCYGKPGSAVERTAWPVVKPGERVTAVAPLRVIRDHGRGSEHVPFSVQLVAQGAVIDLDQPVHDLVPCSDRPPRRKIRLEP